MSVAADAQKPEPGARRPKVGDHVEVLWRAGEWRSAVVIRRGPAAWEFVVDLEGVKVGCSCVSDSTEGQNWRWPTETRSPEGGRDRCKSLNCKWPTFCSDPERCPNQRAESVADDGMRDEVLRLRRELERYESAMLAIYQLRDCDCGIADIKVHVIEIAEACIWPEAQ